MMEIALRYGGVAVIDDADYPLIADRRWHRSPDGYAMAGAWSPTERRMRYVLMHRVILGLPDGVDTDHRDRDRLNNRRSNLRPCNDSQNHANKPKKPGCTSRFKGVTWHRRCRKWQAVVGSVQYLGLFQNEEDAARAYDAAALARYGEFALLNFPPEATPIAAQPVGV
jgi:hypothetical protein